MSNQTIDLTVMSFGYKWGAPPVANLLFDVRFLKNPFWVEELKPLTGRDRPVQDYVMQQPLAMEFLNCVLQMLDALLPNLDHMKISEFTIAFGCTGGQHRSATMVEALTTELKDRYPQFRIAKIHRELDKPVDPPAQLAEAT